MVRRSLICLLCHNRLREATTISECLHTFCNKCIHEKITKDKIDCCPVCNLHLGATPLKMLRRPDHNFQGLRSKIFPLKQNKAKKRSAEDLADTTKKSRSECPGQTRDYSWSYHYTNKELPIECNAAASAELYWKISFPASHRPPVDELVDPTSYEDLAGTTKKSRSECPSVRSSAEPDIDYSWSYHYTNKELPFVCNPAANAELMWKIGGPFSGLPPDNYEVRAHHMVQMIHSTNLVVAKYEYKLKKAQKVKDSKLVETEERLYAEVEKARYWEAIATVRQGQMDNYKELNDILEVERDQAVAVSNAVNERLDRVLEENKSLKEKLKASETTLETIRNTLSLS
ncbi:hypothetical protein AALP_AA1G065500 [Arabis alpina]|uniref:RING-type domain-containing protein n=1 Tax=Arabis alpina TaxID=50452 RepID=A0A087HLJ0_ARAAL|nr:hypothetical protein AALP_AA1G065500 [Arabis alpina]